MKRDIEAGKEYTLKYSGRAGDSGTLQVRAESEVWENSAGIKGFDAVLLGEFGDKDEGETHTIQTHLYEVVA